MNWRQLNIFKGPRQRGVAPPAESETELQCKLEGEILKRWLMPGWRYTHIPTGEKRDIVTAARLKKMGVKRGWPDFIFVGAGKRIVFLELKRIGGTQSKEQHDVATHLMHCGCDYLLAFGFDDAVNELKALGIVRARVSV